MTYIPENRRDTRYPLWYVRYEVTVPYIQTLSVDELEEGMRTSGDSHHDHATMWEPVTKFLPIHLIAELFDQGANVRLRKPGDSVEIYQAVQNHLVAWKNHIEQSFNPVYVPEEDLLILDRFATAIYDKAAPFFSNQWVSNNFKLAGRTRGSRRAIMDRLNKLDSEKAAKAQSDKEKNIDRYDSIDVITPIVRQPRPGEAPRVREQIDYSNPEVRPDYEPRKSLSSFLRRN